MRRLRVFYSRNSKSINPGLVAMAAVVVVGVILLGVRAATSTVSTEVESGTRTANAAVVSDATASGGKAIKFSGGGTVTCPVAGTHLPGASDGMGGCWPYEGNTGVPAGTTLTNYTGPNWMNDAGPVTIDAKNITYLQIYGNTQVTITRSKLSSFIQVNAPATLVIEDSDVFAGQTSSGALDGDNITVRRSEITGGQHSVHCQSNCVVENSYLHAQYNAPGASYHTNAFISNGGANITIRHNTLHCDSILNATDGGCTGDLTLLGDWANIQNVLAEKNFLRANNSSISYCTFAGNALSKPYPNTNNVRYLDNVFERGANNKCGVYGPVTDFQSGAPGNIWSNNRWTDGTLVSP